MDKNWLRRARRITKMKELTPVNDLENDYSSSNDEDDSKSCGSAKVYFEFGAMAAIQMPEDLLIPDNEPDDQEEEEEKEEDQDEEKEKEPERPSAFLNLDSHPKNLLSNNNKTEPSSPGYFSKLHEQILMPSDDSDSSSDS